MPNTDALAAAEARVENACNKIADVHKELAQADAERLRLRLLKIAERWSGITGFTIELIYSSADGGDPYYLTIKPQPEAKFCVDDEVEPAELDNELEDLGFSLYEPEEVTELLGCSRTSEVSVKELRTMSF